LEQFLPPGDASGDSDRPEGEALSTPLRERPDAPLGTLIFRAGLLPAETIESALEEGVKTGKRLGEILTERGLLKEADLARLLAGQKGLEFVTLREQIVDNAAAGLFSEDQARLFRALPYAFENGVPVVAIADPTDEVLTRNIREALGRDDATFVVSVRSELADIIGQVYANGVPPTPPQPAPVQEAPPPAEPAPPVFQVPVPEPEPAPPAAAEPPAPEPAAAKPPAAEPPGPEPAAAVGQPAEAPSPAALTQPQAPETPSAPAPGYAPYEQAEPAPAEQNGHGASERVGMGDAGVPAAEGPAPEHEPIPEPLAAEPVAREDAYTPPPVAQPERQAPLPAAPVPEVAPLPEPTPEPASPAAEEPAAPAAPAAPAPAAAEPAGTYRVTIRLTTGERVEAGTYADLEAAKQQAKTLMAQVAAADAGDWPFVSGRFLKPDTIVSVDIA